MGFVPVEEWPSYTQSFNIPLVLSLYLPSFDLVAHLSRLYQGFNLTPVSGMGLSVVRHIYLFLTFEKLVIP